MVGVGELGKILNTVATRWYSGWFFQTFFILHPRKLTRNPKIGVWKMVFLFKGVIFQLHVSFRGSTPILERFTF